MSGWPSQRYVCIDWDMRVQQTVSAAFGPFFGVEAYDDDAASIGLLGSLGQPWVAVDMQSGLNILASASALIVGYMFVVMVMRVGDISFVAPFRYVSLLVAIILGWVMFKTFPDFYTLVGAAIVVASGIFTLVREGRLARAGR